MIKIGLLGLGTVGQGVVEILGDRKEDLKLLTGKEISIKKALEGLLKNLDRDRYFLARILD